MEVGEVLVSIMVPLGSTLVPVVLILREPDLGTAAVFLPVMFVMLFAAGARRIDLARLMLAGLLVLLLALGDNTFLYPLFYLVAPGFDAVRHQERAFLVYALSAAV